MKKLITILFLATISISQFKSQVNTYIMAPPNDGSTTQLRMPNGTSQHFYQRNCALVLASELTNLTSGTNLTSLGLTLSAGCSPSSVSGNFTVYLQNTSDVSYNKGTNWGTALTGMTPLYGNIMTIPTGTVTSIFVTFTTSFLYTGGGIYVATDWFTINSTTNPATYLANSTGLSTVGGASGYTSSSPAPTTLTNTAFRPCYLFGFANPNSNDMEVLNVWAPGKYPLTINTAQTLGAYVHNASNVTKTNVQVSVVATGANPYSSSIIIPSIPAGGYNLALFTGSPYNPTAPGLSNIVASVGSDQNNNNNSAVYTQSTQCDTWGFAPSTFTQGGTSLGNGINGGIITCVYNGASGSVKALRIAISSYSANTGNVLNGVVLDASNNVVATSNNVLITNSMLGTWVDFPFSSTYALNAGAKIGLLMPSASTAFYPLAIMPIPPPDNIIAYYNHPSTGGSATLLNYNYLGYLGIEAVFSSSLNVAITGPTAQCVGSVTLVASSNGSPNYFWSNSSTSQTLVANSTSNTVYTVTATDNIGCVATATKSVAYQSFNFSTNNSSPIICKGQSSILSAIGAPGSNFAWMVLGSPVIGSSVQVSPTITTTYSVAGSSSAGCTSTKVLTVTVNQGPVVTFLFPPKICLGEAFTINANGASTYSWVNGNTTSAITATANIVGNVTFSVNAVGSNFCSTNTMVTVSINACTGINQLSDKNLSLTVYPNPSHGNFIIESDFKTKIKLFNLTGQLINEIQIENGMNKINLEKYSRGIYFMQYLINERTVVNKIVID